MQTRNGFSSVANVFSLPLMAETAQDYLSIFSAVGIERDSALPDVYWGSGDTV
ncbi:hypothetical protein PEX1_017160 [Penicillium expansum]|uniref:Uncharacterized protein n=1 Tax=Penicillium expansum TaxID=27334 RepID=A0A0A2IQQ7_PENEN|nr:hypothetical protein PEX2_060410 [Penicillium expansum]KGO44778.1 hypothetical protein PEX1_017160 [Penicillium expansum]KGO46715.1 hypothetical protein PEXP_068850 [Penicillium expansum]KGO53434.1 hypothetical protein PEX2_060410 [Penicillium expansum]